MLSVHGQVLKNTDGQSAIQVTFGVVCIKVGMANTNFTEWMFPPPSKNPVRNPVYSSQDFFGVKIFLWIDELTKSYEKSF